MINTVQQNSKFLEKDLALLLSCKCNLYHLQRLRNFSAERKESF